MDAKSETLLWVNKICSKICSLYKRDDFHLKYLLWSINNGFLEHSVEESKALYQLIKKRRCLINNVCHGNEAGEEC